MEPIYKGHAVQKVRFTIGTKRASDRLDLRLKLERDFGYNPDQLTLWSIAEEQADE